MFNIILALMRFVIYVVGEEIATLALHQVRGARMGAGAVTLKIIGVDSVEYDDDGGDDDEDAGAIGFHQGGGD